MQGAACLVIIHRNRLFGECLVSVFSKNQRFRVTHVDHAASDCLKAIEEQPPDVILVDLDLPQGLAVEVTRHFRRGAGGPKVILLVPGKPLLAQEHAEDRLVECLAAGADGCVLEESSLPDLHRVIERVIAGQRSYPPELVPSMCERLVQAARGASWRERVKSVDLTRREIEVLGLVAEGLSNKQIARRLSLSLYTVKNHVHNIVEKLQVESRFKAVECARQRGWLERLKVIGSPGGGD